MTFEETCSRAHVLLAELDDCVANVRVAALLLSNGTRRPASVRATIAKQVNRADSVAARLDLTIIPALDMHEPSVGAAVRTALQASTTALRAIADHVSQDRRYRAA